MIDIKEKLKSNYLNNCETSLSPTEPTYPTRVPEIYPPPEEPTHPHGGAPEIFPPVDEPVLPGQAPEIPAKEPAVPNPDKSSDFIFYKNNIRLKK